MSLSSGALCVALAALAFPAGALASPTYVDQGDGADAANDCFDPTAPCKTIVKGIAQAGAGDTIYVGGGETYGSSLTLDSRKSLIEDDFSTSPSVDTSGKAILDNGDSAGAPDVYIAADLGSEVSGFTIRSENVGVQVSGQNAVIDHNVFDGPEFVAVALDSYSAFVHDNQFSTPTSNQRTFGVQVASSGDAYIQDNDFKNLAEAVVFGQGTGFIKNNTFSGAHFAETYEGAAIYDASADPVLVIGNTIDGTDPGGQSYGIQQVGTGAMTIERTVIDSAPLAGVAVGPGGVTMQDAAITGVPKGAMGLQMLDISANDPGVADVDAQGITIEGKGKSVVDLKAVLTLRSSILDAKKIDASGSGARCHISYSRGPAKKKGGNGCKDFSTTKSPKLKGDGYHLKGSSPMIDRGQPHKPPKHSRDIDGDRRALDGDCRAHHGKKRRDIGADEFRCPSGHHH
jgi:hypothetical protein